MLQADDRLKIVCLKRQRLNCWPSGWRTTPLSSTVVAQDGVSLNKTIDLDTLQLSCVPCLSILQKLTRLSYIHSLEKVYVWTLRASQGLFLKGLHVDTVAKCFSPIQREIKSGSLAVKSWGNRILQTNLRFQTAEHSVPEPEDKSSVSFHSFKRSAGEDLGKRERERGWDEEVQSGMGGLMQIHHFQSAHTHTYIHKQWRSQKVRSIISLIMMKYMAVMWTAPRCILGRQTVTNLSSPVCYRHTHTHLPVHPTHTHTHTHTH